VKIAFLDASSAILLFKVDLLQVLLKTYRIIMAESVYEELTRDGYPGVRLIMDCRNNGRFAVRTPREWRYPFFDSPALHRGERDTLLCYDNGPESFLIIDDGKAARFCRDNGIPYINALLFPRLLSFAGRMSPDDCRRKIKTLITIGRYSQPIIAFAKECTLQDLLYFLP